MDPKSAIIDQMNFLYRQHVLHRIYCLHTHTLCNRAGVSTVKLKASPVHAVTLVWTETTTVSSLTAVLSLATISQLEVDALQPALIASHHSPLITLTSFGLSGHCNRTSVSSGAITTVCVELIFLAYKMSGLDQRCHINFMQLHSCSQTAAKQVCGNLCMTTLASLQKYLFPPWMHLLSASSSRLR
jgi:hypothetical protein